MAMFVVALTGGIGSGKSAATAIFAALGVPVVDVDTISHALTAPHQPLLAQISAQFGASYITPQGALNRPAMRQLVFSNAAAREQLNAILHPAIFSEAIRQLNSNAHASYQILAIPLLDAASPYFAHIGRTLVIDCFEATQISRTIARSGLSEAEVQQIIAAQISREARLKLADDVIENNGSVAQLHEKVLEFHQKYLNTCIVS